MGIKSEADVSPDRSIEQHGDGDLPQLKNTTERRLMAKIDLRILPMLSILYLLAFLDRVNIGNAVIFHLKEDLGIVSGTQYNTALTIFFIPYVLFEIPSNLLLKKLKPHLWLALCMFAFGLITCLQGFTKNYGGILAARFFLGLAETGMFPGCFYLMGMWYKRSEAQKRFSFFFSSTTLAGAFGGLLASAIGKMDGLRGYHGWRWLFIIEGAFSCVVAIIWFFILPDFPEDVKWLTEEERDFIKAKLAKDVGKAGHEKSVTFKDVVSIVSDPKVLVGGFMYLGMIVPAYSYAYFAPTIIKTYGYGPIQTQLYSIPPWAVAFVFAMALAYVSDRVGHRVSFAVLPIALAIAGFSILLTVHGVANRNVQYGALFLITCGTYSAMPIIICWYAMNLSGHKRRAIGTGWQIGFGNIGGIIATYSFLQKDAPQFKPGHSISIAFLCVAVMSSCLYLVLILSRNKKKDSLGGSTQAPDQEDGDLGDLSPNYRYQI
ncbi:putative MFS transporter [Arthroderma uncinatum]|uniref:putative MFS transporter n=1 Tax=Arthroderma uncinatum TaxID=74035 RepID=UPI00144AA7B0|nr:putative MFS transporter [Arthroderma uncinatum]KAF3482388.1 putative MFS transporter [Arthroderma uncinatum]